MYLHFMIINVHFYFCDTVFLPLGKRKYSDWTVFTGNYGLRCHENETDIEWY